MAKHSPQKLVNYALAINTPSLATGQDRHANSQELTNQQTNKQTNIYKPTNGGNWQRLTVHALPDTLGLKSNCKGTECFGKMSEQNKKIHLILLSTAEITRNYAKMKEKYLLHVTINPLEESSHKGEELQEWERGSKNLIPFTTRKKRAFHVTPAEESFSK